MIDALTALFVLCIAAVALFAALPVVQKTGSLSGDQAKATYIATKYIEQLQTLKTSDLTKTNLATLNLIDSGQTSLPYSFKNIPLDDGSYYSPAKMLKGATATLNLTSIDANSVRCDVTISWKSATNHQETLTTGTIIGGYK
ncbi:MAG: hypothetical protein JSS72_04930 [Armatimonadetes bacterium]|nr:hypothetical protein [Armatimonadota bacterium]